MLSENFINNILRGCKPVKILTFPETHIQNTYLIGTVEVLIGAILQNYPYNAKNLKNGSFRKWRIRIQKIILKLQIFPSLYILLEERIKMIEKINPVMEISLHQLKMNLDYKELKDKFGLKRINRCKRYTINDRKQTLSNSHKKHLRGSSTFSRGVVVTLLMKALIFGG